MKDNDVKKEKADARAKNACAPTRKAVGNKLRFIAKHRGLTLEVAWGRYVAPAVQAEFDRCVREANAPAKAGGS